MRRARPSTPPWTPVAPGLLAACAWEVATDHACWECLCVAGVSRCTVPVCNVFAFTGGRWPAARQPARRRLRDTRACRTPSPDCPAGSCIDCRRLWASVCSSYNAALLHVQRRARRLIAARLAPGFSWRWCGLLPCDRPLPAPLAPWRARHAAVSRGFGRCAHPRHKPAARHIQPGTAVAVVVTGAGPSPCVPRDAPARARGVRAHRGLHASQVTLDLKLALPQVAVVGSQSSGKSSVLEALVGAPLLPRDSRPAPCRCPPRTTASRQPARSPASARPLPVPRGPACNLEASSRMLDAPGPVRSACPRRHVPAAGMRVCVCAGRSAVGGARLSASWPGDLHAPPAGAAAGEDTGARPAG
jgi:hypothetical protein